MTDLQRIIVETDAARERGEAVVLATVVNVDGSAYRRPGARMLVHRDGRTVGTISGGCLEADVIERAFELATPGMPAIVRYDASGEDDPTLGFGLGCSGAVDVLLEYVGPGEPNVALEFLRGRTSGGTIATVFACADPTVPIGSRLLLNADDTIHFADPGLVAVEGTVAGTERSRCVTVDLAGGSARVFVERYRPPVRLAVLGAGDDAIPMVRLAKALGWTVIVMDRREALATPQRFAHADAVHVVEESDSVAVLNEPPDAAVIMTHRFGDDLRLLQHWLATPVRYLGVLGPAHRAERLLNELQKEGFVPTAAQLRRLHAPLGIDLGGDTPEQIALSALAEIHAVLHGRGGGMLRDRQGPIHDREDAEPAESRWAQAASR